MNWVTFESQTGGLVMVNALCVAAIDDEQGAVKVSTTAGGVHRQ